MSGFSLYGNERSDITHAAGAVAKDIFLPRCISSLSMSGCFRLYYIF